MIFDKFALIWIYLLKVLDMSRLEMRKGIYHMVGKKVLKNIVIKK